MAQARVEARTVLCSSVPDGYQCLLLLCFLACFPPVQTRTYPVAGWEGVPHCLPLRQGHFCLRSHDFRPGANRSAPGDRRQRPTEKVSKVNKPQHDRKRFQYSLPKLCLGPLFFTLVPTAVVTLALACSFSRPQTFGTVDTGFPAPTARHRTYYTDLNCCWWLRPDRHERLCDKINGAYT